MKQRYESRARKFDTDAYWRIHHWNIQVIAFKEFANNSQEWKVECKKRKHDGATHEGIKSGPKIKKSKIVDEVSANQALVLQSEPYNPYEGNPTALKVGESLDDFAARLKPSSADTTQPWIWCANFNTSHQPVIENLAVFRQVGTNLLEKFMLKRQNLEASFDPPKPAGTITRMLLADRDQLEYDILHAAQQNGIVSGKWLLFPSPNKVDAYWSAVVRGTVEGRLGISAKVATKTKTSSHNDSSQVICVYTKDFNDEKDIRRVLKELIRLGLAEEHVGPSSGWKHVFDVKGQIYYKPDAYTYLDIMSQNEYKIRPSLWATSWLLTEQDIQGDKVQACTEMWRIENKARSRKW